MRMKMYILFVTRLYLEKQLCTIWVSNQQG